MDLRRRTWPVLGLLPHWDRARWPIPPLFRDAGPGQYYLDHFSDDDPSMRLGAEWISEPRPDQPPSTLDGSRSLEIVLSMQIPRREADDVQRPNTAATAAGTRSEAESQAPQSDTAVPESNGAAGTPAGGFSPHLHLDTDGALDAFLSIPRARSTRPLEQALRAIALDDREYVDRPEAEAAIAAAEVVAEMCGAGLVDLRPEVVEWARRRGPPPKALVRSAEAAVARIARSSELRESHRSVDDRRIWLHAMSDLRERLSRAV